jgi:NTP pyrophosphatase (non-canonical NTP hydrolase)
MNKTTNPCNEIPISNWTPIQSKTWDRERMPFFNRLIALDTHNVAKISKKLSTRQKQQFIRLFGQLAEEWNQTAFDHGFDNSKTDELIQIALMHSELGEATEAIRKDITKDDHIPAYSGVEAELADVIIRAANMAAAKGLRLGEAIIAKSEYNKTRSFRHGDKKY